MDVTEEQITCQNGTQDVTKTNEVTFRGDVVDELRKHELKILETRFVIM